MPQLPPQVPQTRRSTYRPMKLMNGDFLTQLKKPLCSELGPEIKGTNKGKAAQCKHTVGLWFKDQTFSLRKLDKAEDAVYETFLQVHKEKRKLQKESHKKRQEEARKVAEDARKRALDNVGALVHSQEQDEELQDMKTKTKDGEFKLPVINKTPKVSKVIEVVKLDNTEPEGELSLQSKELNSLSNNEDHCDNSVESPESLPLEADSDHPEHPNDLHYNSSSEQDQESNKTSKPKKVHKKSKSSSKADAPQTVEEEATKTPMKRRSGLSNFLITPQNVSNEAEAFAKSLTVKTTYRKSFTNFMPVINEDEHSAMDATLPVTTQSQPLTYSYESVFSVPLVSESDLSTSSSSKHDIVSPSANSEPGVMDRSGPYASESLVKINRKKKKEVERRRKMILDMEPFQTYTKDANGEILPAVYPFKKKTFPPPSNKEKYFQKKMLAAQKDARASQDQKIEDFYKKLDVDKDKAYFIRQRVPTPEEKYEELASVGVGIEQLAEIFKHRHQLLPEGVDPQSIEAMQYCQYIRTHDFDTPKRRGTRPQYDVF